MAAHRAQWKGHLKIGELSCAVGLYTAASTSERISFHMINESTGNRLKREFIDSETEEVVERDQQVKGFETGNGDYIMIDPDEVAAVVPDSDKMLEAEAFIPCGEIDDVYFDKPYYLVPVDEADQDAFTSIRDALSDQCHGDCSHGALPSDANCPDPGTRQRHDCDDPEL